MGGGVKSAPRKGKAAGHRHHESICSSLQVPAVRQETNPSRNHQHAINVYDLRVWGEINYLDSSTDYRECLSQPSCPSSASAELEFLDDRRKFPWTMIAKSVSAIAVACVILLIVTSNS
jgi:hypothetical protein